MQIAINTPQNMSIVVNGNNLYVSTNYEITQFKIDPTTGKLTKGAAYSETPYSDSDTRPAEGWLGLALSPSGKIYAVRYDYQDTNPPFSTAVRAIYAFNIQSDGSLALSSKYTSNKMFQQWWLPEILVILHLHMIQIINTQGTHPYNIKVDPLKKYAFVTGQLLTILFIDLKSHLQTIRLLLSVFFHSQALTFVTLHSHQPLIALVINILQEPLCALRISS